MGTGHSYGWLVRLGQEESRLGLSNFGSWWPGGPKKCLTRCGQLELRSRRFGGLGLAGAYGMLQRGPLAERASTGLLQAPAPVAPSVLADEMWRRPWRPSVAHRGPSLPPAPVTVFCRETWILCALSNSQTPRETRFRGTNWSRGLGRLQNLVLCRRVYRSVCRSAGVQMCMCA